MGSKILAGGRVTFLGSFPGRVPVQPLPEVAFAGRSNVGKSSAINRLLGTKRAARVSGTPGRTQAVNLFEVDKRFVFADLPGYGFAKVPAAVQEAWKSLIEGYLGGRQHLKLVVVLVDARRDPMQSDSQMIWSCRENHLPVVVLATKLDKLKRNARARQLRILRQAWGLSADELIGFSSTEKLGVDEAWACIHAAVAR